MRGTNDDRRRFATAYLGSLFIHALALIALAIFVLQSIDAGGAPESALPDSSITVATETAAPVLPSPVVAARPRPVPRRPQPPPLATAAVAAAPRPEPRVRPKPQPKPLAPREIAHIVREAPPQPAPPPPEPVTALVLPSAPPAPRPTEVATRVPQPTSAPTAVPTERPTVAPTKRPTPVPTQPPTTAPTQPPTVAPTQPPTVAPTQPPTAAPTHRPTAAPTEPPTIAPTQRPTATPTEPPTVAPTQRPTATPTAAPTPLPLIAPTRAPTASPTRPPTAAATAVAVRTAAPLPAATAARVVAAGPHAAATSGAASASSAPNTGAAGGASSPAPELAASSAPALTAPAVPAPAPAAPAPAAPAEPPSGGGLGALNARLRAALPTKPTAHMETVPIRGYTTGGVLDEYEKRLAPPLEILAKTFGLIYTTRTITRADSVAYVYERTRDLFGHELCRAFKITEHPLRSTDKPVVPFGPGAVAFPAPLRDVPPVIETVTVLCDDKTIEHVAPGSITTRSRAAADANFTGALRLWRSMSSVASLAPFSVEPHPGHPRLRTLALDPARVRAFLATVAHVDLQQLAYVPFMRFVLADELDRAFDGRLLEAVLRIVRDRATGGFTAGVAGTTLAPDDFVRLGTAFAHLVGPANFDAMSGTYYARFTVEHTDASDSYLRQAYRTMMLHTDGTYVSEATDYLLLMKFAEANAVGGESRLLHLDDWEDLAAFTADPIAHVAMPYQGSSSKNVSDVVQHATFSRTPDGWGISFIDQFARPQTIAQGRYLERMLASMEASPATREVPLPIGDFIVLNNAFWMHGRAAFAVNERLHRELMRIRGAFAE